MRVAELIAAGSRARRDRRPDPGHQRPARPTSARSRSAGSPTYVIGGRGYWAHPQVLDLVAYLQALANPRDEEALYTVLASPLVGVSLDALVVLGRGRQDAAARTRSPR